MKKIPVKTQKVARRNTVRPKSKAKAKDSWIEIERAINYLRKTGKSNMTWQEALGREPLRENHR